MLDGAVLHLKYMHNCTSHYLSHGGTYHNCNVWKGGVIFIHCVVTAVLMIPPSNTCFYLHFYFLKFYEIVYLFVVRQFGQSLSYLNAKVN